MEISLPLALPLCKVKEPLLVAAFVRVTLLEHVAPGVYVTVIEATHAFLLLFPDFVKLYERSVLLVVKLNDVHEEKVFSVVFPDLNVIVAPDPQSFPLPVNCTDFNVAPEGSVKEIVPVNLHLELDSAIALEPISQVTSPVEVDFPLSLVLKVYVWTTSAPHAFSTPTVSIHRQIRLARENRETIDSIACRPFLQVTSGLIPDRLSKNRFFILF
ncbi:MAG: hypothetical protein J5902_06550 [Paludibacteraceae bacterium]|nr:hypothetical protein [Paludibacteraceae bacterium]